jgi:ATP-dependent DNA helicase RecG
VNRTIEARTPLRYLKGVGPRRGEQLSSRGLTTVEDLLYVFPFRYEDRRSFARIAELEAGGDETTLDVQVVSGKIITTRRRGFTLFEAVLSDSTGTLRAVWYNQPYLERLFVEGRRAIVFGRAVRDRYGAGLVIENPDYEFLDGADAEGVHTGRIVPVYRKLGDLGSRMLRNLVHRAIDSVAPESLAGLVPPEVAERHRLLDRDEALRRTHFPPPETELQDLVDRRTEPQRTLAFEEIFVLQLALALRRYGVREKGRGIAYEVTDALRTRLARLLPFSLTGAQKRVLKEIGGDLRSPYPMNRLLQGDVGSGKTIVALLTLLVAVENGYQGAFMAPTEILADQHYRNLARLLERKGADYRLGRLTGSLRSQERRQTMEAVASGELQLVVGTHALFERGVRFHKLGLVVVDEQHRFGVMQRAALVEKGVRPDVLVMTATPIPRSLALTCYGDLDLSVIDELPPGRTPIRTVVRLEEQRNRVYDGARKEVERGRQVYIVVPLVEETERSDLKAATSLADRLRRGVFSELRVGLVHGRMKGEEKDRTMQEFAAGEIQVLVATTVIEVGVDVSNATVMIVEHAERFGLSQLHQLRGRVGRGADRSYCVLMVGEGEPGAVARERLRVMEATSDGFRIAEKDLEIRGPGEVFGTQQHGLTDLQFLSVVLRDPALVDSARLEAQRMIAGEAAGREKAQKILSAVRPGWRKRLELARAG